MIDKTKAITLRTEGYSYKEISNVLGCSEAWCKKELRGSEKGCRKHDTVDDTKMKAISILEDALKKVREL